MSAPATLERKAARPRTGMLVFGGIALLVIFGGMFAVGYMRHWRIERSALAAAERHQAELPVVNVAKVRRSGSSSDLMLPGNITPITEAYLYARAAGYISKRYADIGDRVKKGQLLAEIEAPELLQQVAQARAAAEQAEQQLRQTKAELEDSRSQLELAQVTWNRYKVLAEHGAIARQDADQQFTNFKSARSNVNSAEANVAASEQNVRATKANLERLIALEGFTKIRAPFEGIITSRSFDVGALISVGGSSQGASPNSTGGTSASGAAASGGGGAGGELFRIAQIGTLRILINVPQESATAIKVGQPATIFLQELSKTPFIGRISRTSNSIDPATRTLLTEVQVANPQQLLMPGMYAQVQLAHQRTNPPLLIPGDSVLTTANGLQVAVLQNLRPQDKEGHDYPSSARRIHLQKIEVGRDYGPQIEVTRGLEGWEHVVVNPNDEVEEGAIVEPATAAAPEEGRRRPGGAATKGGEPKQ